MYGKATLHTFSENKSIIVTKWKFKVFFPFFKRFLRFGHFKNVQNRFLNPELGKKFCFLFTLPYLTFDGIASFLLELVIDNCYVYHIIYSIHSNNNTINVILQLFYCICNFSLSCMIYVIYIFCIYRNYHNKNI